MRKAVLIPTLVAGILVLLAGSSIGIWYALAPSDDSELSVVSLSTDADSDTVSVVLTCEGNESGHMHRFQHRFAYMHKLQFRNSTSNETMFEQQYQWQWRHRIQNGKNHAFQFQIEGLEKGQMLQLRIEYNNGKVLTYNFTINH